MRSLQILQNGISIFSPQLIISLDGWNQVNENEVMSFLEHHISNKFGSLDSLVFDNASYFSSLNLTEYALEKGIEGNSVVDHQTRISSEICSRQLSRIKRIGIRLYLMLYMCIESHCRWNWLIHLTFLSMDKKLFYLPMCTFHHVDEPK